MENKLIAFVSSLLVVTRLFAAAEAPAAIQRDLLVPSRSPFCDALPYLTSYDDYCAQLEKFKNKCGICCLELKNSDEEWLHPFGDSAHAECVNLMKRCERSIKNFYQKKATRHSFRDIHRLAIWYLTRTRSKK